MFKIKDGYFSSIECPQYKRNQECSLLNCIYKHPLNPLKRVAIERDEEDIKRAKPETVREPKTPEIPRNEVVEKTVNVEKTKEVEEPVNDLKEVYDLKEVNDLKDLNQQTEEEDDEAYRLIPMLIDHLNLQMEERCLNIQRIADYYLDIDSLKTEQDAIVEEHTLAELSKYVEEYREYVKGCLSGQVIEPPKDPKYILPREVRPKPPANLAERKKYIELFAQTLKKKNPSIRTPILKAIDEEYLIASTTSVGTYNQSIKKKVYQLTFPEKFQKKTKTFTREEYLKELDSRLIPKEKLAKFGYIMEIPQTTVPEPLRVCNRCGANFRLDQQLQTTAPCRFHAGKVRRKDKNTRVYDCCGVDAGIDNDTCAVCPFHVFSWNNAEEKHWSIPYLKTSDLKNNPPYKTQVYGIDCEMGYTTRGFELLRTTAVDFFTGADVFDVFTKPIGTVIDLNTKYSGIAEIKEDALTFEETVVFMAAYINPKTILIGHGLENDMNAMRLIHERIIDTAILYPKYRASPTFRYRLKDLAFTYLSRNIQTGEHDSREDSLAAIDIVKHFIKLESK